MLAASNQLTSGAFYFRDGRVEISGLLSSKHEMRHAPVYTGEAGFGAVLVEGDEILTAGGVEKDHLPAVAKAFFHPEHSFVEPERTLEVAHDKMDMRQPLGSDIMGASRNLRST